jgi:predicted nucleic acid-binding protein
MTEAAVVNASPLIFLARAGRLDLLRAQHVEVHVPDVVADEILARGAEDVTARALGDTAWLRVVTAPATPPSVLAWDLGSGESAVLSWALAHRPARAIIDDLSGRRCAEAHGIPLRGTLGIVLLAKVRRQIPSARAMLAELRKAGMYLSDRVVDAALAEIGE